MTLEEEVFMHNDDEQRQTLLNKLARGIAYSAPILALAVGGASIHAISSDVVSESGYQMMAEAEGEGEAEGEAEAEAEAEGESEDDAEGEGEGEGEGEEDDSDAGAY
jgi:hypothetical protein